MSDGEALLAVLAFLYLSDCFCWLRKGSVALVSAWARHCSINTGGGVFGNSHGSVLLLNPLPPFGRVYTTHPVPISISPDGLCDANLHAIVSAPSPKPSVKALSFEQISAVSSEGAILRINNARFAKCGSNVQAAALVELIKRVKATKLQKREHLIRDFVLSQLSRKDASARLEAARPHLLHLTILSTAFFLFLFLFIPWMATRTSASAILLRGALGAVILAMTIGFAFYRAHSKLFPVERFERVSAVIKMVLCPPMAIQAVNHLTIPLLSAFHPVTAISVLQPKNAKSFFEAFLRRQKFGSPTAITDATALRICEWFNRVQAEEAAHLLKELDPALSQAAFAAPQREGDAQGYCPRCLSQYGTSSGDCPDCTGVNLLPFPSTTKTSP